MVVLAAAWTAGAQGTSEAILGYYAGIAGIFLDQTAGWTFQVATPITVTELGCLVDSIPNNSAAAQIEVGLWAPNGSLLASNFITPGSPLVDQSRYEPVAPLALGPGQTYSIGIYVPADFSSFDVVVPILGGSISLAPEILLFGTASGTGGFTSPSSDPLADGGAFLGPNFRFQSQPALAIQLSTTNQVRLSWPAIYPGFTLQYKLGLSGTWTDVAFPPATGVFTIGSEFVVFDPLAQGTKFYRLRK